MTDAPIIPQEWVYGLNVVDIGDLRVARGQTRRPRSACQHKKLVYDTQERRVYCSDCEADVHPFDAFTMLAERYDGALKGLRDRAERVKQAEQFAIRSRAAKVMDDAWRSRTIFPCCPHCRRGITPKDVVNGVSTVGQQFETARRK